MRQKLWVLLLVATSLGLAQPVWGDDGFYVIGGGRGVGTPITPTTSLPYTISQPGFYYLTGNLSSTGNALIIGTSEVTLDLMGFNITGPGATSDTGIYINAAINDVEVRNGSVKGFSIGVNSDYTGGGIVSQSHRFSNLRVSGCGTGIRISIYGGVITGCQATGNSTGFYLNSSGVIIDKNTATLNTGYGFYAPSASGVITNNSALQNGTGFSLGAAPSILVDRNSSAANTTNWTGLSGCTVGTNTS